MQEVRVRLGAANEERAEGMPELQESTLEELGCGCWLPGLVIRATQSSKA